MDQQRERERRVAEGSQTYRSVLWKGKHWERVAGGNLAHKAKVFCTVKHGMRGFSLNFTFGFLDSTFIIHFDRDSVEPEQAHVTIVS